MSLKTAMTGFACALLTILSSSADAAIVRFDFDGTVFRRFNNGLPDASDIFGLSVTTGDAVSGSFTIDTAATVFGSLTGSVSGAAAGYTQTLPGGIRVELAGGTFTSDGDYATSIAHDFQDGTNPTAFEQFALSDGVSSGSQNITGDTILLNANPETARLGFTFQDNDFAAFSSTTLPTSLDLSLFEIASGAISGTRPSGQTNPFFYSVEFSIDSITATAVPEPSSMALLASVAGVAMVLRRRRHSRTH
ncbi:hypothetical protein K227x_60890 [Rubripirellula lacrimiformis]|uniref:Ice-binding protein C-terminal domain-containing protein n=1 Tax=Rubripirellula lacrimiformis TaxID=1930273 RepID=A0A517NKJ3_9BACT|nr:PEP-CTERM sorting domain-containing protein [Rubripirellula lacrimiformis]QDT07661.1 hypothetical protein K227x_60890 [Rubripirellula lacrimiformis]